MKVKHVPGPNGSSAVSEQVENTAAAVSLIFESKQPGTTSMLIRAVGGRGRMR